MCEILARYSIPDKIIKAIEVLYRNTKSRVIISDGETDTFKVFNGDLQGDTLAPFLLLTELDYILRISLDKKDSLSNPEQVERGILA